MAQIFSGSTKTPGENKGILQPSSNNYPTYIKECFRKPPILYFRGNISLLKESHRLAVVGSRIITESNQHSLRHVLSPIIKKQLVIISGLAIGMDTLAHTIAIDNQLPTIAVLGSSVESREIYPKSNSALSEAILASNGLLISPFTPGYPIHRHNFPSRNNVIAALSSAILVASAAKRSGALITARCGLDNGRDVLVIPGRVGDPIYEGCNNLLIDGATPITSPDHILAYFGLGSAPDRIYKTDNPEQSKILEQLQRESISIDELISRSALSATTVSLIISTFELRGWITIQSSGIIQLN